MIVDERGSLAGEFSQDEDGSVTTGLDSFTYTVH